MPLGLLMGRFASSVRLRIEKQEHVTVMFGSGGLNIPVDKLRVVHPTRSLPSTNRPNNAVPESRQEGET
jgi:hypothetical protein